MSDERSPYLVVFGGEEPTTPTPWKVEEQSDLDPDRNGYTWAIRAGDGAYQQNPAYVNTQANAALIVRACNLHAELLDALEVMTDHAGETYPHFESERGQRDIKRAQAVLAKARGEA